MPSGVYKRTAACCAATKAALNRPEVRAKISAARTGKHHSQESIKKMSAVQKIVQNRPETKAKQSAAMKKYYEDPEYRAKQRAAQNRPEVRAKNSAAHKGLQVGEKNHNWKGGISTFPYHYKFTPAFKQMIRNRDGNICQLCGKTKEQEGRNLCVHHIFYDRDNECVNPDEFITLCNSCNFKVNTRRDFWTEYFQLMLDIQNILKKVA